MRKIFGHRGLPHIYEENTFKSLNKALEICDFVETDVRITKDEELVLYHDTTIQTKQIEECTLSDIDELIDIEIPEIHLISREQIKGDTNFELKINFKFDQLNNVFLKKIINLTNPEDIVSSFDWETILNNRKSFKQKPSTNHSGFRLCENVIRTNLTICFRRILCIRNRWFW